MKEAKMGFFFDKTDSLYFVENHTRMDDKGSCLQPCYFFKTIAFKIIDQGMTIQTIRLHFFKLLGNLSKQPEKLTLNYQAIMWNKTNSMRFSSA